MNHQMLVFEHRTGQTLFECPACSRRLIVTWTPWSLLVLDEGDDTVTHFGSVGPVSMNAEVKP